MVTYVKWCTLNLPLILHSPEVGFVPFISLIFFPQPPGVAFQMVLDTSLSFHLKNCFSFSKGRDKTRVIVYRCPGNTAVQVTHFFSRYENIRARFIGYRILVKSN